MLVMELLILRHSGDQSHRSSTDRIMISRFQVKVDPKDFFLNVVRRFKQIRAVKGDALRGNMTTK